jgi:hypothetical protein
MPGERIDEKASAQRALMWPSPHAGSQAEPMVDT